MDGVNIVGVQFRRAGRIYAFVGGDYDLAVGDSVVVDTDRGLSLAKVAELKYVDRAAVAQSGYKSIVRKATDRDLTDQTKVEEERAEKIAKDRVAKLGLKMHVLKAEAQFTGNKIMIYFSAPGRVDFRDLVKDLAANLKARVELKQVGARDEAKLVGGVGICGREFCCSSFLREFVPVSIKMAKNQNLALNPAKVSGGCGRLLCCLTYENDVYSELRRKLPGKGAKVRLLDDGAVGTVLKTDYLNQILTVTVPVEMGDPRLVNVPLKNVEVIGGPVGGKNAASDDRGADGEEMGDEAAELGVESLGERDRGPIAPNDDHDDGEVEDDDGGMAEAEEWGRGIDINALTGGGSGTRPTNPGVQSQHGQSGRQVSSGNQDDGKRRRKRKRRRGRGGQGGQGGGQGGSSGPSGQGG